jgi:hypothetical protein
MDISEISLTNKPEPAADPPAWDHAEGSEPVYPLCTCGHLLLPCSLVESSVIPVCMRSAFSWPRHLDFTYSW